MVLPNRFVAGRVALRRALVSFAVAGAASGCDSGGPVALPSDNPFEMRGVAAARTVPLDPVPPALTANSGSATTAGPSDRNGFADPVPLSPLESQALEPGGSSDGSPITSTDAGLSAASGWPQFRGPSGDGAARVPDIPTRWGEDENLLWKSPLPGAGASTPAVDAQRVYLTYYDGYGVNPKSPGLPTALTRWVAAFDRRTGETAWSWKMPSDQRGLPMQGFLARHGFATGSVACASTGLVASFGNAGTALLNLDGTLQTVHRPGSKSSGLGALASPQFAADLLVLNSESQSGNLEVLRGQGEKVWESPLPQDSVATPLVLREKDGSGLVILNSDGKIHAFDLLTGKEVWSCRGIRGEAIPSPVAGNGMVFVTGGKPREMTMAIKLGGEGDVTTTHVVWRSEHASESISPVFADGHLFVVNERGKIVCLDPADGSPVNELQLETRDIFASPVSAAGKLIIPSRTDGVFVVSATPKLEVLARNTFDDPGPFNASPAVVDGALFLRSNKFLYCVGRAAP